MTYAVDYSWARPAPTAIRAAGYTGVLRYVSRPDTNGKNITKAELDRLRAAGLDVTLNFEQYERRPLEGNAAGVVDAQSADRLADLVGYPRSCAIYYSVDFAAEWPQVRAYFLAVKSSTKRPVGIYAGLPLCLAALDERLATYAWVTNAASWSGKRTWPQVRDAAIASGRVHLLQHLNANDPYPIAGSANADFDANTIVNAAYGQWSATGSTATTEDDDVSWSKWSDLERLNFLDTVSKAVADRLNGIPSLVDKSKAFSIQDGVTFTVTALTSVVKDAVKGIPGVQGSVDVDAVARKVVDEMRRRLDS